MQAVSSGSTQQWFSSHATPDMQPHSISLDARASSSSGGKPQALSWLWGGVLGLTGGAPGLQLPGNEAQVVEAQGVLDQDGSFPVEPTL